MVELRDATGTPQSSATPMSADISIVTSGHDIADARLHRHVAALREQGFTVEVLALGHAEDAPHGVVRAVTRARPSLWKRVALAREYARQAIGDVLISLDPESAFMCRSVARKSGKRFVADVHEDYVAVLSDRTWSKGVARWGGSLLARLGNRAAANADLTVVADIHLMTEVPDRVVVRNVPNLPAPATRDPQPRAVYVGDLRRSRGLFDMLDVVEQCPHWELDLVGPVAPQDAPLAHERVAALDGRVRIHGRMRPDASWALADGAWVGFSLLHDTPAFRDAAPSKIYEYLAHGIPVVATDLPVQAGIVNDAGAGVVVTDIAGSVAALKSWEAAPDAHETCIHNAVDWVANAPQYAEGSVRLAEAMVTLLGRDS
ncbi:glycosyltransferase [Demequina sediminicola]|uniref:glycosyltransferase n=1 Tax=Demequina sediminicola TaxID=1095026 RepID=UPI000781F29F|nr:glycosyltransferase [Demequina sediminicola]